MAKNNMAVAREALMKIEKKAHCDLCNVYPKYRDKFNDIIGGIEHEAHAALALPRLNCEVGTVEEQAQRFNDYCHKQGNSCCIGRSKGTCPMFRGYKVDCALVWSQTPYEESEVKK